MLISLCSTSPLVFASRMSLLFSLSTRRVVGKAVTVLAACSGLTLVAAAAPAHCAPSERPTFDPCLDVACKSRSDLASIFSEQPTPWKRRAQGTQSTAAAPATTSRSGDAPRPHMDQHEFSLQETSAPVYGGAKDCPADRETLGAATWTLLHSLAAYYPEKPNRAEQDAARGVIDALRLLYPCMHCRERLQVHTHYLFREGALNLLSRITSDNCTKLV